MKNLKEIKYFLLETHLGSYVVAAIMMTVMLLLGWSLFVFMTDAEPDLASVEENPDEMILYITDGAFADTQERDLANVVNDEIKLSIEELRQVTFNSDKNHRIKIWSHKGGYALNEEQLRSTIAAVLERLPNLPHTKEMEDLIFETLLVETHLGKADYNKAIKKYKNYGIAQIRKDTAEETLWWLGIVRRDVKKNLMTFYDNRMTLEDNLLTNIPFSIAMAAEIYWRADPRILEHVESLYARAATWKSVYNSSLGLGSEDAYLKRVMDY